MKRISSNPNQTKSRSSSIVLLLLGVSSLLRLANGFGGYGKPYSVMRKQQHRVAGSSLPLLSSSQLFLLVPQQYPSSTKTRTTSTQGRWTQPQQHPRMTSRTTTTPSSSSFSSSRSTTTSLGMGKLSIDGTGRGLYLQIIVVTIALWFFTIPPEFRRTTICKPTSSPEEELQLLSIPYEQRKCKTSNEFIESVQDYYRNGGGIQWDFSIDPGTIEKNKATMNTLLGK